MPSMIIEGPPATPPTVSLVRAGQTATNLAGANGRRWEGGFTFIPRNCASGAMQGKTLCPPSADPYIYSQGRDAITGVPFELSMAEKCSTFGFESLNYQQRVKEEFEAFEPKGIEHEFWTGTIESDGLHLASGGDVTDLTGAGSVALSTGLAALEQYLADTSSGGRGMIHMSRRVFTEMVAQRLIREDTTGGVYTYLGTIVVPGTGYPGTGPNGEVGSGSEWIYATSWVQILRSEIMSVPDRFDEALDRSINQVAWLASRRIGIAFDPCVLGTIAVTVPTIPTAALKTATVNATSDGDNVVIGAVTGKRLLIEDWSLESTTTGIVTVKDSAANILRRYAGGSSEYESGSGPSLATATGEGLLINNQAGQDTVGVIHYREV